MGRAYEVRKASIEKTGAARGKIYSVFAKEIYQAAKNGGTSVDSNHALKRLIERAKKEQVPSDIIKRAIDKVNSDVSINYVKNIYEMFGPANSTLIIECLTDNVNRSVSELRTVVNKCHVKLGSIGSISYNYDNLCIVSFSGIDEETVMEALINNDCEIIDMEYDNNEIVIYGQPSNLFKIKEIIIGIKPQIEFNMDEITMLSKEKINLNNEDLELFKKMLNMLNEIEDVNNIYHNVENI